MIGFLLDTSVVAELGKDKRCDPKVSAWAKTVGMEQEFLSVLAVGELRRQVDVLRDTDSDLGDTLGRWVTRLTELYPKRILPVSLEVAQEWGRMRASQAIGMEVGLLAATAQVHGLTLVTLDSERFDGLGISVLNPCL